MHFLSGKCDSANQSILVRSCISLVDSDIQTKSFLSCPYQKILAQKNPLIRITMHFSVFAG